MVQGGQSSASYMESADDWPPPTARVPRKSKVAQFCAAPWPNFTPALTAGLRISRAMASKHVSDLEATLGVKLIHRTTRRLSLTEAGTRLTEASRDMLALLEQAEQEIVSARGVPRGTLRINAPTSFGIRHLGPIVSAFLAQYPEVRVELTLDDAIVDIVDQGYDLAIRIRRLEDSCGSAVGCRATTATC
jgi:DNA-binding transcriptional LysR family regulator